jgi:hypothetical protein
MARATSELVKWSEPQPAWQAASGDVRQARVKFDKRSDSDPGPDLERQPGGGQWHPPRASSSSESHRGPREIALDSSAPTGHRLRAIEQLESRALGKPKETVEHQDGESEADRMLDRMSTEEFEELARSGRHLRVLNEEAAAAGEPAGAGD